MTWDGKHAEKNAEPCISRTIINRQANFLFISPFNTTPMVQTDHSQLNQDCRFWIGQLRNSRSEINDLRSMLQKYMSSALAKSSLPEVEQSENRFDMQLSNINNLEHAIRDHLKQSGWQENMEHGQPLQHILTIHESLDDQCAHLVDAIGKLKDSYHAFFSKNGGVGLSVH
jgi:hypothetical protein